MDNMATAIAILIGMATIFTIFAKFVISQTKILLQITQIQKDIEEIKNMTKNNDENLEAIEKRVTNIETKCQYIQELKEVK